MAEVYSIALEDRQLEGMHLRVSRSHADEVVSALTGAVRGVALQIGGRGTVQRLPISNGHALLRPHRRGGLIRCLLDDGYLFRNRPLTEFTVHCEAFERGAPVVEPLGVRWEQRGCLFRGALLTRWVNAAPLASIRDDAAAHGRAGAAVAALHAAGVYHADLNANNILVDADRAWVIDLDRAKVIGRVGRWRRGANILRLERSYTKLGLPPDLFHAFLGAYGAIEIPWPLRCLHAVRTARHRGAP